MNTPKLITIAVLSAGLVFGATAQGHGKKHHEEQEINSSDVPAAVQQAADKEASGGKIVRWEKEGANYEAVIDKDGKQWGYKFDANGKMMGKHDESKEEGKEKAKTEKGEKY
jgi:hypothetical protein